MEHKIEISFLRKRFEEVNNYYGKNQGIPPYQSIIRIEERLKNGQGTYEFNLRKEELRPWESNLLRNDLFVVTHLGIMLSIQDPAKPGTDSLLSYALTNSADNSPVFATKDINALYNGFLSVETGTVVNMSNFPLGLFKHIPMVQPSILALDDGEGNTTGNLNQPAFEFLNMLHPMAERLTLTGTQDHRIRITFPTFPAADYSAGENIETKVVFIALGYRVPGGTAQKFKDDTNNPFAAAI